MISVNNIYIISQLLAVWDIILGKSCQVKWVWQKFPWVLNCGLKPTAVRGCCWSDPSQQKLNIHVWWDISLCRDRSSIPTWVKPASVHWDNQQRQTERTKNRRRDAVELYTINLYGRSKAAVLSTQTLVVSLTTRDTLPYTEVELPSLLHLTGASRLTATVLVW